MATTKSIPMDGTAEQEQQYSVESITPETAKRYLTSAGHNRDLKSTVVRNYARQMSNGEWKLTHQGIAFSRNGQLIDGQHRLHAVIESGVSVPMLVARGADEHDVVLAIDTHARRSPADCVSLYLSRQVKKDHIALVRAALLYCNPADRRKVITNHEYVELLNAFAKPIDFLVNCRWFGVSVRGVTMAPVSAALAVAWYYESNLDRLSEAVGILTSTEMPNGESDRSIVTLKDWLVSRPVLHGDAAKREVVLKAQRGIHAFMGMEVLSRLYATQLYYEWPLTKEAIRR